MSYASPLDICNRALQHCGVSRINSLTDDSRQASECNFAYDKLRRAELRRNVWRFAIRKTALRAISDGTMQVVPVLWAKTTTYAMGNLVTDTSGYIWQSQVQDNLNNDPTASSAWEAYCGPTTANLFDSTDTVGYYAGEIVYKTPGDGTYIPYMSLINGNTNDPATGTAWDATVTYYKDQVVLVSATYYVSLADFNLNNNPASSPTLWSTTNPFGNSGITWIILNVTLADMNIIYPLGSGPTYQSVTNNIFPLPNNFLRRAPQDPKAGSTSFLGAPTGLMYDDWKLEGKYIVSRETYPIVLRFVADLTNVASFDDMFCEMLGTRVALEVCEILTQSTAKIQSIGAMYKQFGVDARMVNGIETGPTESQEDDYVTCRI